MFLFGCVVGEGDAMLPRKEFPALHRPVLVAMYDNKGIQYQDVHSKFT